MNEIEIIYLRYPVHPSITEIRVGPGIEKIVRTDESYWVHGTSDGPLAGKMIEIPADNIAAVQWKVTQPPESPAN
jgi:hypothetical protein